MRALACIFAAATLVACSSSSSSDDGTQDGGDDSASDGTAFDAPTDTPADSSRDAAGDVTPDGPFPDTLPETTPVDTSTDGGSCGGGAACTGGLVCCADECRNTNNDPSNCGVCGSACSGATSMCLGGTCSTPVCAPACDTGTICCELDGPGPTRFECVAGTTCPVGCPGCD